MVFPGLKGTPERAIDAIRALDADHDSIELRADAFDVFNHPNFGSPDNGVGTPTFGKISRTRLPTGEAGSSRQIQLAAKLLF